MAIIKNNRANIHTCFGFKNRELTLLPGVNEVSAEDLEEVVKSKAFNAMVDDGVFTLEPDAKPITDMSEKEAVAMVGETVNAELLGQWATQDKRKKVLDAIKAQLEAIKPTPA